VVTVAAGEVRTEIAAVLDRIAAAMPAEPAA